VNPKSLRRHLTKVIHHKALSPFVLLFLLFGSLVSLTAQDRLPSKIRGYKVHSETLQLVSDRSTGAVPSAAGHTAPAKVFISDPEITDISLTGVGLSFPVEVLSHAQSGKVDFLSFHEVRVNDIAVELPDYDHRFKFEKGRTAALPEPAHVLIPTAGLVKAAWQEMRETKETWTVTGRVFVFGKFRKFGFHHKRVVPVDFEIVIDNPFKRQPNQP
jgi:hypothetical protein